MVAAYKSEVGKGHEARVRELFRAFDGRQKLHDRSLPRFCRVERREVGGEEFDLVAEVGDAYWIGEVKARPARGGSLSVWPGSRDRRSVKPGRLGCGCGTWRT